MSSSKVARLIVHRFEYLSSDGLIRLDLVNDFYGTWRVYNHEANHVVTYKSVSDSALHGYRRKILAEGYSLARVVTNQGTLEV